MFRCVIKYLLWLFLFLRMAIEVGSCLKHKDRYIKDAMNYLEIILYTFTIFYLMEIEIDPTSSSSGNTKRLVWFTIDMYPKTEWQQAFGSLAILGSWLNLLMFIRQMPKYGLYVLMFTHVLTTFMEFVVVLFIFICAFSFTFIMLLGNKIPFHNIPKSIVTTLVMMIGEMDYGDKLLGHISEDASGETPEFTNDMFFSSNVIMIVYSAFCILMSIIVMNLMTGLAVDDIDQIRQTSEVKKLSMLITESLVREFDGQMDFGRFCCPWITNARAKGNISYKDINITHMKNNKIKRNFIMKFFIDEREVNPDDFKTACNNPLWQPIEQDDVDDIENDNLDEKREREFVYLKNEFRSMEKQMLDMREENDRMNKKLDKSLRLISVKLGHEEAISVTEEVIEEELEMVRMSSRRRLR